LKFVVLVGFGSYKIDYSFGFAGDASDEIIPGLPTIRAWSILSRIQTPNGNHAVRFWVSTLIRDHCSVAKSLCGTTSLVIKKRSG
jgi:hypothetical protein